MSEDGITIIGGRGAKGDKGEPGATPTGDLLVAVHELTKQVTMLTNRLEKDYPRREEVKHEGRKRMFKALAFGVVLILIAQLITISTISYCFLSPNLEEHRGCSIIPGYEDANTLGKERLERFLLLIEQIEKNEQEIAELKEQVNGPR
jgi:hypothetical protein